jgi:hypothetical protein
MKENQSKRAIFQEPNYKKLLILRPACSMHTAARDLNLDWTGRAVVGRLRTGDYSCPAPVSDHAVEGLKADFKLF